MSASVIAVTASVLSITASAVSIWMAYQSNRAKKEAEQLLQQVKVVVKGSNSGVVAAINNGDINVSR